MRRRRAFASAPPVPKLLPNLHPSGQSTPAKLPCSCSGAAISWPAATFRRHGSPFAAWPMPACQTPHWRSPAPTIPPILPRTTSSACSATAPWRACCTGARGTWAPRRLVKFSHAWAPTEFCGRRKRYAPRARDRTWIFYLDICTYANFSSRARSLNTYFPLQRQDCACGTPRNWIDRGTGSRHSCNETRSPGERVRRGTVSSCRRGVPERHADDGQLRHHRARQRRNRTAGGKSPPAKSTQPEASTTLAFCSARTIRVPPWRCVTVCARSVSQPISLTMPRKPSGAHAATDIRRSWSISRKADGTADADDGVHGAVGFGDRRDRSVRQRAAAELRQRRGGFLDLGFERRHKAQAHFGDAVSKNVVSHGVGPRDCTIKSKPAPA